MSQNGIKQRELASRAGVSQATVSRALSGKALRHGAARQRLFTLVDIDESQRARERVIAAFDKIWDHSDVHADAITQVIDALGAFGSPLKEKPRR